MSDFGSEPGLRCRRTRVFPSSESADVEGEEILEHVEP